MRDHGGDLEQARQAYGDGDWIDLSTGINPVPFPMPQVPAQAWSALPSPTALTQLERTAAGVYHARAPCLAVAGAQAAIQLVPRLMPPQRARVLGPTYNEHAAALEAEGWHVTQVADLDSLRGADLAVVVNPNNPDGRQHAPGVLLALAGHVGLLVIDESFADPHPDLSVLPHLNGERAVVLRSFGKFYGLAGLRLGFALGDENAIDRMRAMAGPWAVSGAALVAANAAFSDPDWAADTCKRLKFNSERLDLLLQSADFDRVGGTALFRTYAAPDARAVHQSLAQAKIWSRVFPYSKTWLRLGFPADDTGWDRLEAALPKGRD